MGEALGVAITPYPTSSSSNALAKESKKAESRDASYRYKLYTTDIIIIFYLVIFFNQLWML